jgi:hypothetical protein
VLRLHYVQKPIGYERYEILKDDDVLQLSSEVELHRPRRTRAAPTATLRAAEEYRRSFTGMISRSSSS